MGYRSLSECISDLEKNGHLVRVTEEVDPDLEMAEIQRRVYDSGGPALFFEHIRGCGFRAVSNLFGTMERCRFIFRDTLEDVKKIVQLKADPSDFFRSPLRFASVPFTGIRSFPRRVAKAPVLACTSSISRLPRIRCWPGDGGPFITLPQVYSEDPMKGGVMNSNLGMYRIQMAGNDYETDTEAGLHYQIHRGIGVHHAVAIARNESLRVSVFVGGPPAHTLAAVMPLPEGLTELIFAGMLGRRRFRYVRKNGFVISADADFCILGTVEPEKTKPEGPFGDHLGYYSLVHDFPVLDVKAVYHRKDAVWPFTVVGRPPQEDTSFGRLIHEITAPMVPREISGLRAVHAVDAAGVHPLLLAVGSERYCPYRERFPQEIITIANALLGFGQCSLAKYLFIVAGEDNPSIDCSRVDEYLCHFLERVDWRRDVHFQTRTTMDTLDYSGTGLNRGSKVIMAAAGPGIRELAGSLPGDLRLPPGFHSPVMVLPGIMAVAAPPCESGDTLEKAVGLFTRFMENTDCIQGIPMIVLVDDSAFCSESLRNFLWITFTRSDPASDIHGVGSFTDHRHWGCTRSLVIDARLKPHHAPPLVEDPKITRKVERLGVKGGSLYGII